MAKKIAKIAWTYRTFGQYNYMNTTKTKSKT